jgi:hypothetical protein
MESKITLLKHSALVDVDNVTGKHDRFYDREREKVTKQIVKTASIMIYAVRTACRQRTAL